jgi:hypothetical protein
MDNNWVARLGLWLARPEVNVSLLAGLLIVTASLAWLWRSRVRARRRWRALLEAFAEREIAQARPRSPAAIRAAHRPVEGRYRPSQTYSPQLLTKEIRS